jgi:hypothetical protein
MVEDLRGVSVSTARHGTGGPGRPPRRERGQTLVIVALAMVALMGMLALTFDGGYAFFQRRLAQTAADAGALAGARARCTGEGDPAAVAVDYAVNHNAAHEATAEVNGADVYVETSITFNTFFASVLGRPEVEVRASAQAGCFVPDGGTGMLPVAWNCGPPTIGDGAFTETCDIRFGPGNLYVIMDSDSSGDDYYCQEPPNSGMPPGAIDCDIDNDGSNDIFSGGNRSWLDLDGGGGGAQELQNWVMGGYAGNINIHTWFGGQTGVANSVFQAAGTRVGHEVVMPVFDMFCALPGVPEVGCPGLYHFGEDTTVVSGGTSTLYFHVISFSIFHITCVSAPGVEGPPCPGKAAAVAAGAKQNIKKIEGYFVEGYQPGYTGRPADGVYAGVFTLYLTR